ncbi:MAG: hypothetical protein AB8B79_18405 [Granulosicoccus sp.]
MRELIRQYFDIAFLMGKPQDLPAGDAQMRVGIALALITYILALAVPYGVGRSLMQALIDLACSGCVMWLALHLVGRKERFEQAFGGLCGASMFINLAALPLYSMRPAVNAESNASMAGLADFVLLVWGLSLLAHVVRHTFEVKLPISILISFIYFILLSSIIAALMPAPATTDVLQPVSMFIGEPLSIIATLWLLA